MGTPQDPPSRSTRQRSPVAQSTLKHSTPGGPDQRLERGNWSGCHFDSCTCLFESPILKHISGMAEMMVSENVPSRVQRLPEIFYGTFRVTPVGRGRKGAQVALSISRARSNSSVTTEGSFPKARDMLQSPLVFYTLQTRYELGVLDDLPSRNRKPPWNPSGNSPGSPR